MESYVKFIIKFRYIVLALNLAVTFLVISQIHKLTLVIDPDEAVPQSHPYIQANNKVEKTFGNKYAAVIGITAKEGTIFQSKILEKIQRITEKLMSSPDVVKSNVNSIAARKTKDIVGNDEGMIVRPLMEKVPSNAEEMERLKNAMLANPMFSNLLISKDLKTTQIVAEFKRGKKGMQSIEKTVRDAIEPENDSSVEINVSGQPIFLSFMERYSGRLGLFFLLALVMIGLIHYEAFRTWQALFLPLITAVLAVTWAIGFLVLLRQPFDVFNAQTPILILAIAAGHAVQILKRYYEEFAKLKESGEAMPPRELNKLAVLRSLTRVGPVMIAACFTAALGFFSLVIFEIKTIQTFGIFTGIGVLSALVLELTFIPALRSLLPAPGDREFKREKEFRFWDRVVGRFFNVATGWSRAHMTLFGVCALILFLGCGLLRIENDKAGMFFSNTLVRRDDDQLNAKMGGTNTLYVLFEGSKEGAMQDPNVLKVMDETQVYLSSLDFVGKTVSIVDYLKKMNLAMNGNKQEFFKLPQTRDLIAQYLFLYSNSGSPEDLDSYVDFNYKTAVIQTFFKTDSSKVTNELIQKTRAFIGDRLGSDVKVSFGGNSAGALALNEVMIHEKALNILQIMGAVFLISSIVFRSFFAGMLILVPLVSAVFANYGVMGLLGIPLNIITALIGAMAVGIGADYGIYLSYRLREELRSTKDEKLAIANAYRSAGKAVLFVSTAVAGGFGVLALSYGFWIHVWMGFLIAIAMLVSSVTSLTLFPALILGLRPKFIFESPDWSAEKSETAA